MAAESFVGKFQVDSAGVEARGRWGGGGGAIANVLGFRAAGD